MYDTDNKYTGKILRGKIKPDVLVDIIESNRWDEEKKCMVVEEESTSFRLVKENEYQLMYPETNEGLQWPVICKPSTMEGSEFSNKISFIL